MRRYVKHAIEVLGFDQESFVSHVTPTLSWASINWFSNGWSAYYIINFDREFVERQPTNIKKAIAAHEVGHAFYSCAVLSRRHQYGMATYLEKENCADIMSAIVYEYEWTMAALMGMKEELPESELVDARIKLLKEQLGGIPEREDLDLTYWDE